MKRDVGPSGFFDDSDGSDDDDQYHGGFSFHPFGSSLHGTHLRGWGSVDHFDPSKFSSEKTRGLDDVALISAIDQKMKEHADVFLHAVECLSARVSQMESRTRRLENSMDDLRVVVEFNHGNTDKKLNELETVLVEVRDGIKDIRDKQDIAEARLRLSKLDFLRADLKSGSDGNVQVSNNNGPCSSASPPSHQPSPVQVPQHHQSQSMTTSPPPSITAPQPPYQPPQNLLCSFPYQESYYQLPVPTSASTKFQPYDVSSTSLLQLTPHVHQPYQPHFPESSQFIQLPATSPPFSSTSPHVQYPSSHAPQLHEWSLRSSQPNASYTPKVLDQTSIRQYPTAQVPWLRPQRHSRTVGSFQDSSSSVRDSSPTTRPGDGRTLSQLPLLRALPHAIPTATDVDAESSSSSPGNRVPVEDVVDKVVAMGFRRDLVTATAKKLTENGQSVDLNVVLDKLMNNR